MKYLVTGGPEGQPPLTTTHDTEAEAVSAAKELAETFKGIEVEIFKLAATVKSEPTVTFVEERKPSPIDELRKKAERAAPMEPVEVPSGVAVTSLPTRLPPPNVPGGRVRRMPA